MKFFKDRVSAKLPEKPRMVFRVGFAGSRKLGETDVAQLKSSLLPVLKTIGNRLAALSPGVPVDGGKAPPIAHIYDEQYPQFRLVTGLCEGADQIAAETLEQLQVLPDKESEVPDTSECVEKELAAVLPFSIEEYRQSRPESFRDLFDNTLEKCSYVLALDGKADYGNPDKEVGKMRRSRAYRAQAALLLRHCDVLVAAADPSQAINPGSTLETVRAALDLNMWVCFINTVNGDTYLLNPDSELSSAWGAEPPHPESLKEHLDALVTNIVADPILLQSHSKVVDKHGIELLDEYLTVDAVPQYLKPSGGPKSKPSATTTKGLGDTETLKRCLTFREIAWSTFESRFKAGPPGKSDPPLKAYEIVRKRAADLSAYYSGLYRGAFLLNYWLAVFAVMLAAFSLALLAPGSSNESNDRPVASIVDSSTSHALVDIKQTAEQAAELTPSGWLFWTLLLFGLMKLCTVYYIGRNTHKANDARWNDRAIDYRYLAERFRFMYYLPQLGSFRPTESVPAQYASRAIHQSAVDWLFNAYVRAISPADQGSPRDIIRNDNSGTITVNVIQLDVLQSLKNVRDNWIHGQILYHTKTAATMARLLEFTRKGSVRLGRIVIAVVVIDLLILLIYHFWHPDSELFKHWVHSAHAAAPWLIALAAILPAMAASLNGTRFQSECSRLLERSALLRVVLGGRSDDGSTPNNPPIGGRWLEFDQLLTTIENQTSDPGAWSLDALRLTEKLADDFNREVSEWTVLYAKEIPET